MRGIRGKIKQFLLLLLCVGLLGQSICLAAAKAPRRASEYVLSEDEKKTIQEEINLVKEGKLDVDTPDFWQTYHKEYANDSEYIRWYHYYQQNGFDNSDDGFTRTPQDLNPYTQLSYTHDTLSSTGKEIVYGIDVSYYQGTINWTKVKEAGIEYAILRAGYGRELSQKDKTFEYNYVNAKANGIKVGAYWYSYADSISRVKAEAQTCAEVIKGKSFDLPIWFDQEYEKNILALTNTQRTDIVKTFISEMQAQGYKTGLYCSRSFLEQNLNASELTNTPFWLARYGVVLNSKWETDLWQYSSQGKVRGISGNVDCDFWYVTKQEAQMPAAPATGTVTTTTNTNTNDGNTDNTTETPSTNTTTPAATTDTDTTTSTTPEQVKGLKKKNVTTNSISLTWSEAQNAVDYQVYIRRESDSKYKSITVTGTSCTLSGLLADTKYVCIVRGRSNNQELGENSAVLTISTEKIAVPSQVTGLKKNKSTADSISFSWDNASGAQQYEILCSDAKNGTFKTIGTTTKTSYTAKKLSSNTGYYFKVYAVNDGGRSKLSNAVGGVTSKTEQLMLYPKKDVALKNSAESGAKTLVTIPKHTVLNVAWKQKGSDGAMWYRINYTVNNQTYSGYLVKPEVTVGTRAKATVRMKLMTEVGGGKARATLSTTEKIIIYQTEKDSSGKVWRRVVIKRNGKLLGGYCPDKNIKTY